jgi:ATP adenylyltransferase
LLHSANLRGMDYLWTPWRYAYVSGATTSDECIFCAKPKEGDDRKALIPYRGTDCYVILNAFPYTSGHVMIVPFDHVDRLAKLPAKTADEMMRLAQRLETALCRAYNPEGLNLGMNIGKAAGAGVAGHVHLHVLPRWTADSNFMTVVGETRGLPEALETTFDKLNALLS